ncbi:hypothetical protein [Natronoflexus pectinivorans]|uniref:Uncharacterized protein n=1 Tax=Natronoflexus pectinivorans TaxID=682526 RepID=A0A4R2G4G8_9BACT|nr:hypothetical protein [Natronoflexus pectinivorans]TCO02442.1 hypothetical protein EV194_1247 [Natronoflexus pectinivorans]
MTEYRDLSLEIREYPNSLFEVILIWFILLLWGFAFIMFFIEVNDKIIARISVLLGVYIMIIWYFSKYIFQTPKIIGHIFINQNYINFKKNNIEIKQIEFLGIKCNDYRGKIKIKRTEFPFPSLGTKNEIKIFTKNGLLFESEFFIRKKKDIKRFDKFIKHWSELDIRIQYIVNNKAVYMSNGF